MHPNLKRPGKPPKRKRIGHTTKPLESLEKKGTKLKQQGIPHKSKNKEVPKNKERKDRVLSGKEHPHCGLAGDGPFATEKLMQRLRFRLRFLALSLDPPTLAFLDSLAYFLVTNHCFECSRPSLKFVKEKHSCVFPCLDQGNGKTPIPKVMRNDPKGPEWRRIGDNRLLAN